MYPSREGKMANTGFYQQVVVPFNEEVGQDSQGREVQFVNPVQAAEHFVRLSSMLARLTEKSALLTEQVKTLEVKRSRAQRELNKIRRKLLAGNYSRVTKTASVEVMDAFIWMVAQEVGGEIPDEIERLEEEIEEFTREIERRTPRLEEYKNDQKLIERTGDYLKQFLDFSKLEMRLTENVR